MDGAVLKDESVMFFRVLNYIGFSYEGKPCKIKYRFVTYTFQGPLLSSIVIFASLFFIFST
jgi:hypothetical protein